MSTKSLSHVQTIPDLQSSSTITNNCHKSTSNIPDNYALHYLRSIGHEQFNNKETATVELQLKGFPNDPFYIHREYLVIQSTFFRDLFKNLKQGDLVIIEVPSPETFSDVLEWLYTGNSDKFYDAMTEYNWHEIWENVEFLGLGVEAKTVCMAFYQEVIDV
ncbi:34513_t:CDS:1 [Racocetra persica]|uniref:34513_t:CDS:1 n=1 Tax=Racocetra persica TaxID=160502 RepID=A0ACA9N479_9GLOM|nr:34513_t:CDS:1 [Racocetra persica]